MPVPSLGQELVSSKALSGQMVQEAMLQESLTLEKSLCRTPAVTDCVQICRCPQENVAHPICNAPHAYLNTTVKFSDSSISPKVELALGTLVAVLLRSSRDSQYKVVIIALYITLKYAAETLLNVTNTTLSSVVCGPGTSLPRSNSSTGHATVRFRERRRLRRALRANSSL